MPEHFQLDVQDRVAVLAFSRPEKRNPLNDASLSELISLLQAVRDDSTVRVLVLTGSGNTFCAGADLSDVKGISDPDERRKVFAPIGRRRARLISRAVDMLANLEQATVAAINGYAIGGGWSFALACDFRIAAEEACFWFPEVDLGVPLSPASSSLVLAHAGLALTKEIIMDCRRFTAPELLELRLLHRVVKREALTAAAREWANAMAARNPTAVMVSKATINALARNHGVIQSDLILARE